MSRFLDCISTIISVFHKHVKEDGDCSTLSRRRMKEFLQKEFADAIAKPHDPQTIDKILQFLEWDSDGKIDFNEFLLLVFRVAKACYWYLPKGASLLQRTKLTTTGKSLQELEVKTRGSRRQLQEEEEETWERNQYLQRELDYLESEREIHEAQKREERDDARRKVPVRERRIDRQRELDLEVYEQRRRLTREREERDVRSNNRETQEDQDDGRRQREAVSYERTRETEIAAAEDDVKIQRETRGLEPREVVERRDRAREHEEPQDERRVLRRREREEPVLERRIHHQRELDLEVYEQRRQQTREREERDVRTNQRETRERADYQTRELDDGGRRQHEARETLVLEPREVVGRRDHAREREEADNERRVLRREREEPVLERRIDHQREIDLEVYEQSRRLTEQREERDVRSNQRETRERTDSQARELDDGRRQRQVVRYKRTRETEIASAEADGRFQRETWVQEPREEIERRDRAHEREEAEVERRVLRRRER
ncbi:RPTN protein, partial [Galbula dea]|nr:RPTN protein [Galbula dea]